MTSSELCLPDKVPTPIASASVIASNVIAGPNIAIPLAIFLVISSLVVEFRANTARALALDRSIRKKKNGRASLERDSKYVLIQIRICSELSKTRTLISQSFLLFQLI